MFVCFQFQHAKRVFSVQLSEEEKELMSAERFVDETDVLIIGDHDIWVAIVRDVCKSVPMLSGEWYGCEVVDWGILK